MVYDNYECSKCGHVMENIRESAKQRPEKIMVANCLPCGKSRKFDFIPAAPYTTFGMLTAKYTGQKAAVSGWGTHNLDYGKGGSDLVAGRAREIALQVGGGYDPKGPKRAPAKS